MEETTVQEEKKKNNKQPRPQVLRCAVQNYDWGKIGEESEVARLFSLNSRMGIEVDKPYAEFWMGTHDSGPSFVVETWHETGNSSSDSESVTLKSWISENPRVLGDKVVEKWGHDLPFLFKVLSVAKALSIQAHPDKELARALHNSYPNLYKDDNHKPEMALALTKFEALCGFVSLEELKGVLHNVPEIVELVGSVEAEQVLHVNEQDGEENKKFVLQQIFTSLMSACKDSVSKMVSKMKSRLIMENKVRQLTDKEQLVLRLEKQYPADIGVLSAFFLNHVKLNPGEALYLGANEPHAYIYGECVECMATSDNVVRAGLTSKLRDVPTLCSMLTYRQSSPDILQGVALNPYVTRYMPPFDEFEVDRCSLPEGESTVFPAIPGPSLFVATRGIAQIQFASSYEHSDQAVVTKGSVLFVPADTEITVKTATTAGMGLELYRAGVNSRFFFDS
ncbi:Mannose-6-phosphate isomerase [Macleaya cordata]|uniref:mannose-6-phosphate isomerase n=1 Tax=Macleaya cordata TaxID=56857 RepID=A0A200Q3D6_MACCD|nr:Mannose-6-phosphate isomerase [Macleaya cordata]